MRADLSGTTLYRADLSNANLSGLDLRTANFRQATLCRTNLSRVNLSGLNLTGLDLTGADLTGASCLSTDFSGATLNDSIVYGISAWNVILEDTKQANLHITPIAEADIAVDNLEVAQFLYVLLHNQKVRAVLDTITSKVVLILGRFGAHKPVLDRLREALRDHPNGYIPVMFDFERPDKKPPLETVKTLAHLARFVVADLTDPNMIRSELSYITSNAIVPVTLLIEGNAKLPTEYADWKANRPNLPLYRYPDLPGLVESLNEAVIAPAEELFQARRLADADGL